MVLPPLLLLDVDGVLNALGDEEERLKTWPSWSAGRAESNDHRYRINWAPVVVDLLRTWHEQGALELQWLTTWGHDANLGLAELLGMPTLEVAGTHEEESLLSELGALHSSDGGSGGVLAVGGASHAAGAPSAPDPLTDRWWKYDVVRRVLEAQPGRTVIWVDDELHETDSPFVLWASEQPDLVTVGPHPMSGLSADDLAVIAAHCRPPTT